jgi:hypothetical protein
MESAKADDVQDLAKALGQMATNILDPNTQADSLFSSIVVRINPVFVFDLMENVTRTAFLFATLFSRRTIQSWTAW